jgi:hypothetical protein
MSIQSSKLVNHETSKLKRLTYFPSLEFRLVGIVIFLVISFFSTDISAYERNSFSVYAVSENNLNDSIVGFGVSTLHKINNSNVGIAVDSSLSNAEVVDTYGYEQSYLAWEVGAKVGYFSTLFIYAEFGFDFGELAFQDRDEDVYYYEDSYEDSYYYDDFDIDIRPDREDYSNDIDAYLGLGTGVDFGHVQLTAFARYRQIDGEFWKANNQTFTGIKTSISF